MYVKCGLKKLKLVIKISTGNYRAALKKGQCFGSGSGFNQVTVIPDPDLDPKSRSGLDPNLDQGGKK
jgi:hypothetical protein